MNNLLSKDTPFAHMIPCIRIWPFEDAPHEYKALSSHGGDEDWIAYIPSEILDTKYLGFLEAGTPFGCYDVQKEKIEDGEIWIGAHS